MNPSKRAFTSIASIASGWALMGLAYDKPEWYFQVAGVVGVSLVLGAAVWWFVSARRAANQSNATDHHAHHG